VPTSVLLTMAVCNNAHCCVADSGTLHSTVVMRKVAVCITAIVELCRVRVYITANINLRRLAACIIALCGVADYGSLHY
jgi:hypothetical protein